MSEERRNVRKEMWIRVEVKMANKKRDMEMIDETKEKRVGVVKVPIENQK